MHRLRASTTFGVLICVAVGVAGTAGALTVEVEHGGSLGSLQAPAGESLVVRGDGDLHLRGTLSTSPEPTPGADGPDLDVHASGILVLEEGARLVAGDGRPGSAVEGLGLAEAGDGGHGGDVVLSAERVVTSGAGVVAGTGGDGGDATANGSPDARALAGDGGPAGRVLVHAPVVGVLDLTPGNGGDGGFADARGQDAPPCEGGEGEPATDNRSADPPGPDGSGASANASATAGGCGPWDGTGGGPRRPGRHRAQRDRRGRRRRDRPRRARRRRAGRVLPDPRGGTRGRCPRGGPRRQRRPRRRGLRLRWRRRPRRHGGCRWRRPRAHRGRRRGRRDPGRGSPWDRRDQRRAKPDVPGGRRGRRTRRERRPWRLRGRRKHRRLCRRPLQTPNGPR